MATSIRVEIDPRQERAIQKALSAYPKRAGQAVQRSVARATKAAEVAAVRAVGGQVRLTQTEIRTPMKSTGPGVAMGVFGSGNKTTGRLSVRSRPYTLSRFKPRQTKRGVTFAVYRSGPRKRLPQAFLAPARGARPGGAENEQVFERRLAGKRRVGRKPIDVKRTASARSALDRSGKEKQVVARAAEVLAREISRRIDRILNG